MATRSGNRLVSPRRREQPRNSLKAKTRVRIPLARPVRRLCFSIQYFRGRKTTRVECGIRALEHRKSRMKSSPSGVFPVWRVHRPPDSRPVPSPKRRRTPPFVGSQTLQGSQPTQDVIVSIRSRRIFGAHRPASTGVFVAQLTHPRWFIEVEAVAARPAPRVPVT